MTNWIRISILDDIEKTKKRIKQIERSYISLKDKSSMFSKQHLVLLEMLNETLLVYEKFLMISDVMK